MKAHLIKDGKILNTIIVNSLDFIPGLIDAEKGGGIGDAWDGEKIIPAKPIIREPTPDEIIQKEKEAYRMAEIQEIKEELLSAETKTIAALKTIMLKMLTVFTEG